MSKKMCAAFGNVQNKEGEIVESELFKDSLSISNDRKFAKTMYNLGHDLEFLDAVGEDAVYDSNGEITFASIQELTGIDVDEYKVLEHLNKNFKKEGISYQEAVSKVEVFNTSNSFREKYMATLEFNNNKYNVSIVERTAANEDFLEKQILQKTLQDKLITRLAQIGVSVDFLIDAPFKGRYSTENAEKTTEDLYNLIQLLEGENTEKVLSEETGHLIVGMMKDNIFMDRLLSLMTPEVQQRVLGSEYSTKELGATPERETAGVLIGRALLKNEELENSSIKRLIDRVLTFIKKALAKLTRDQIELDIIEAREIAESIAKSFFTEQFEGSLESALQTKETLYDKEKNKDTIDYLDNIALQMRTLASELVSLRADSADKAKKMAIMLEGERVNIKSASKFLSDAQFVQLLANVLLELSDLYVNTLPTLLILSDVDNQAYFWEHCKANGLRLRQVRAYVNTTNEIIRTINFISNLQTNNKVEIATSKGTKTIAIGEILSKLKLLNSSVETSLEKKEHIYFLNYNSKVLGKEYVTRAARVCLQLGSKSKKGTKLEDVQDDSDDLSRRSKLSRGLKKVFEAITFKTIKVVRVEETTTSLDYHINNLAYDDSPIDRFLFSAGNSSDIITNIADNGIKHFKKKAEKNTQKNIMEILAMQEEFKSLMEQGLIEGSTMGKAMEQFYETDLDNPNEFTSFFVDEYHWGLYYKKYDEFIKEQKDKFFKLYPEFKNSPDLIIGLKFQLFIKEPRKAFFKEHTVLIKDPHNDFNKIRVPVYKNPQWENLSDEAKKLLQKIKHYKEYELDMKLEYGELANGKRAPQFYANYINNVRNNMRESGFLASVGKAIGTKLRNAFTISCTEESFGSEMDYFTEENALYTTARLQDKERINKVPLYGIKKLKNSNEMSTDIFGTMIAYAAMANTYEMYSQVSQVMEVGTEVLKNRKLGSKTQKNKEQKAYTSYCKHVEKSLYKAIGSPKYERMYSVLRNMIRQINSLARAYLMGSVHGGMVNALTGLSEMFKESVCGEYFTVKLFNLGMKEYFLLAGSSLLESSKDFKTNTLDMFVQYYDVLSDNTANFASYDSRWYKKYSNFISDALWFPYKSGEHFMQCVPYISVAIGTNLYKRDENGDIIKTNLWEYFKSKGNPKDFNSKLLKDEQWFASEENIEKADFYDNLIMKIEDAYKKKIPFNSIDFTPEEGKIVLKSKTVDHASLKKYVKDLKSDLYWGDKQDEDFSIKCREICNRMHGVYNFIDKTTFQTCIMGELLGCMRGYLFGAIQKRFSKDRFDVSTKNEGSGSTLDGLVAILSAFSSFGSFGLTARMLFLPIIGGEETKKQMLEVGFSEHQYYNMRRNQMDWIVIAFLTLGCLLLAPPEGDDDDELEELDFLERVQGLAYYVLNRVLLEARTFVTIKGLRKEWDNFMQGLGVGVSIVDDLWYIITHFIGQTGVEKSNKRVKRGSEGYEEYIEYRYNQNTLSYSYGDSKAWFKLQKLLPYWKTHLIAQDPYKSLESYMWERRTK